MMYNNQAINKDDKSGISDEDQIFLLTLKEIREDNKSRIIGILKEHPEAFNLITIPVDDDIKKVCIENDPAFILRVDQDMISDDLIMHALKIDPFLAKSLWSEIEDDDELIQNLLNQNGLVISCMPDDIKEDARYRRLALSNNPLSMVSLINYMDLDEIKKVVSQKGSVLKYISDGKLYQRVRKIVEESTEDMVVQNNDQFILEMTHSQVRDIYMTACLAKDPFPASSMRKYWLTEDFIIDMVKQSPQSRPGALYNLLSDMPDELITLDILKMVAEKRPALYISSLWGYHPTVDEFKELYNTSWRVISAITCIRTDTSSYVIKKFVRENVLRFGEVSDPLECAYACNYGSCFIDYPTLPRFAKFISKCHYNMITRIAWDILDTDHHNPQTIVRPDTYEYWKKLISIRQGNWLELFDLCCNSKVYFHYKITRSTKKILRKLKRQEIITYGLIDYLPLTKVSPIGRLDIQLSIGDIILAFKSGIRKYDLIREYNEKMFNPIKMLLINILDKIYDKPVIEPVIGQ